MKTFIVAFLLLVAAVPCLPLRINDAFYSRANWGVTFNHVSSLVNGVSHYHHTYALPVPTCQYVPIETFDCTTSNGIQVNCAAVNDMINAINRNFIAYFNKLKRKLDVTLSSVPAYTQAPISKRRKRDADRLSSSFCDDPEQSVESGNYAGRFFSNLLGLVQNSDILTIVRHLCQFSQIIDLNSQEIENSNQRLSSISQLLNARITSLQNGMTNMNDRIREHQTLMDGLNIQLQNAINNASDQFKISLQSQRQMYVIFSQLEYFQTNVLDAITAIEEWLAGFQTLLTGYLPPQMITVSDVTRVLDHIRNNVLKNSVYEGQLSLLSHNPAYAYQYKRLIYGRDDAYLYVTMKVPLASTFGQLNVFRVDKHAVAISQRHSWATKVNNVDSFFAITSDHQYYAELSSSYYMACEGQNLKICPTEISLRRITMASCASALFSDNARSVQELCDIQFEDRPLKTVAFRLNNHRYWIHAEHAGPNVTWSKYCIANNVGVTTSMEACKNCILEIPCQCSVTAMEFVIPMNLEGCNLHLDSNRTDVLTRYPLNLAFAVHYRPMQNTYRVSGNETLSQPYDIGDFNFNVSRLEWDDVVQRDAYFAMDFKKIIKNMKANRTMYHDNSQRLLQMANEIKNSTMKELEKTNSKVDQGLLKFLTDPKSKILNIPLNVATTTINVIIGMCVYFMK